MSASTPLDSGDYQNLAKVAQGQSSLLDPACAARLLAAGLVWWMDETEVAPGSFQLTPAGLALIHSSDQ